MKRVSILENFEGPALHPGLAWRNPPAHWHIDSGGSKLVVTADAETDFWQRTHYGFRADSGHFLGTDAGSEGAAEVTVSALPVHQYDQAGLMLRAGEECWVKTSVEYEPSGASQLGAVVTNHGFSDWSLEDFRGGTYSYRLRVKWKKDDLFVEYADAENGPWRLIRVAHLSPQEGAALRCGLYACSPKGPGFQAQFQSLHIETGG
jgi:uncharacterized protein